MSQRNNWTPTHEAVYAVIIVVCVVAYILGKLFLGY